MDFDASCLDSLNLADIDVNAVDVSDFDFDTIAHAYAQPNEDTICDCSSLICVHHYNRQHQVKELKRFYNCLVKRGESVEFKDEFFPGFRCIQSYGRDYHEIIYVECNNRTQYGENTTRFVDTKKRSPELFILFHNGRYFQCRGNMVQCYSLTNKLGGPWVVPGENPEDERALQPHGVNMPRDADETFEPPEYRATWLFKDIRWRGLLMQSEEAFYSVVGCDARDGVATFTFEPVHRIHPGSRQAYFDQEEVKWYFVAKKMTGIRVLFADNITPHSLIFEVQGEVRARGRSDAFLSRARDFLEPLRMGAAKAQHFFEACVGPGLWEDTCVLWLPRFRFNPKQCFYDIDFAGLYILRHWKNHGTYVGRRLDNQLCLLNEAFETLKDPARYSIRGMVTLKDLLLAPMMSEVIEHMKTFQTDGRLLEALLFVRELVSKFNIHEPDSIRLDFYFLIHKKYCRSLKLADLNLIRMCVVHPPVTPHYVVGDSKLRTEKIMGDVRRLTTEQVTGDFPDGSTLKGVYANAPAHVRPITPHARRVSGLLQPQDVTWAVQGAAVRLAEAGSSVTESTTADSYCVTNALGESEGTTTCGAPDAATGNSGALPGDRSGPSRVTDGGDDNTVDEGGTRCNAVDATDGDNRGTSVARSVDCGEDRSTACVTRDKSAIENDGYEERGEACALRNELVLETDGKEKNSEAWETRDKSAVETDGGKERGEACVTRNKRALETVGDEESGEACALRDELALETHGSEENSEACEARDKSALKTDVVEESGEACVTRDKPAVETDGAEDRGEVCVTREKSAVETVGGQESSKVCVTRDKPAVETDGDEDRSEACVTRDKPAVETDGDEDRGEACVTRYELAVETDGGKDGGEACLTCGKPPLETDGGEDGGEKCAPRDEPELETDCGDDRNQHCATRMKPSQETHGGGNRTEECEACVADKVDIGNTSRAAAGAAVPPSASYDASARTLRVSHTRGSPVSAFCTDEASRAPASPSRASTAQPARSASPSLKAASQQCRSPHHVSDDHAVFPASPSQQAASPQQRSPNEVFPLVVPTPEAAHWPQELTNETGTSCPHSNALETDAHLKSATVTHAASSSWRSHWWSQEPSSKWTREQAPRTKGAERRWWHEDDIWLGESGDGWSTTSWGCRAWDKENTEVASHTSWARSAWDKENTEGASHTSWARSAWNEKGADAAAHKPWAWSTWDKESAQAAAAAEKKPWYREARAWGNKHDARGAWSSTAPRRSRQ